MKRFGVVGVLAVFALTTIITITEAQQWKGWKGGGGWGYNSQYQRMYNTQTGTTVKGVVEAVEQVTPKKGMSYGIHLKLKTDSETLPIHLGPVWFIERQDIKIEKGDTVEVLGSKITFNNAPAIIAAQVTKGDSVLTLRDNNGIPVWAGTGMGRGRGMGRGKGRW